MPRSKKRKGAKAHGPTARKADGDRPRRYYDPGDRRQRRTADPLKRGGQLAAPARFIVDDPPPASVRRHDMARPVDG